MLCVVCDDVKWSDKIVCRCYGWVYGWGSYCRGLIIYFLGIEDSWGWSS